MVSLLTFWYGRFEVVSFTTSVAVFLILWPLSQKDNLELLTLLRKTCKKRKLNEFHDIRKIQVFTAEKNSSHFFLQLVSIFFFFYPY